MQIKTHRRGEGGVAVLLVLVLISLMLALVTANTNALFQLKREVKLLEDRQVRRWIAIDAAATNAPPSTPPVSK